jgi:hypothetical protein
MNAPVTIIGKKSALNHSIHDEFENGATIGELMHDDNGPDCSELQKAAARWWMTESL